LVLSGIPAMVSSTFPSVKRLIPKAHWAGPSSSSEDLKRVEIAGHTLKGMLANLSATRAVSAASRLEEMGRTGEKSGLKDAFMIFEVEMAVLLPKVDEFLQEAEP
jgi:HPt (histidine-containing phosphotransfer) domain-containing protein